MKFKLFLTVCLLILIFPVLIKAASNDKEDEDLRKAMEKSGYVSIVQAVSEFEKSYKHKVKLPKIPFASNHQVGMIANDQLSIDWIDTSEKPTKSFHLFVREANEKKLFYSNENTEEVIMLTDGNKAYFEKNPHYFKLVFRKDHLEYCYRTNVENGITKEEFIQIADSFK
jgi:hypothetical protein